MWIEIRTAPFVTKIAICHSLRGLCGLKSEKDRDKDELLGHSLRGLCGLKFIHEEPFQRGDKSQPARAVWIEMFITRTRPVPFRVTACEGCVD